MKPRKHFEQCQLYCAMEFMAFCDLGELASRLANPFGHLSQVRTQVLVLQTCVDLRVRLARASNSKRRTHVPFVTEMPKTRVSIHEHFVNLKQFNSTRLPNTNCTHSR